MRKKHEDYWMVSLPKEHEALRALDAYCQEWGGLSRPEATRRLLLEWSRVQRGLPIAAWQTEGSSLAAESVAAERAPRNTGSMSHPPQVTPSARAARRVLDE